MADFLLFLLDLNDHLDALDKFFSEPGCPEDAYRPIEQVRIYEEKLCQIIEQGDAIDRDKASQAYDELSKHLKTKPHQLAMCYAPQEVFERCHDP